MAAWNPNANEIFLKAIELTSVKERRAYLDQACGNNAELRRAVETLLTAHQDAGSFLQTPALEPARTESLDPSAISPPAHDEGPQRTEVEPVWAGDDLSLDFLSPSDNPEHLGRLGPYEITELVGHGGMGVVLKAHDTKLNRVVAIKVLSPELAGNATARKRFLREAQAAAAVTHQHVVTIHAVDEDTLPYLVMEFVDGLSLQQKIDQTGPLSLTEILRIGSQIASGLAAAHAQGLIHRDVKPANILLENGVERVRITDFGLARAVDDVGVTKTGEVTGTPQYMSPEQAEGRPVDSRSDLFSLGSVLYAMCTGRSPFRAETTVASLRRVCDDTPRRIREINPEIPEWLTGIIERLLKKYPNDRFQTASEVADLLGGYLAHVQDPGSTPFPGSLKRLRRGWLSRGWLGAVVVSLLVLVTLGLTEVTGITNLFGTKERAGTSNNATGDETGIADAARSAATVPGPQTVRSQAKTNEITEIRRFEGHTGPVKQVAVSHDGTLALSGSGYPQGDRSVRLWEVATGRQLHLFDTFGTQILTVCFSPDAQRAAAAGFGGVVYIWDVTTGQQIASLKTNAEAVDDLEFSQDGRYLLCATHKRKLYPRAKSVPDQGAAQLWDTEAEEMVWQIDSEGWLVTAAFLPEADRLVVAGWNTGAAIHFLDPQTGNELHRWGPAETYHVEELAVSHDGQYIATATESGYLSLWDATDGGEPVKYRSNMGNLRSVAFSPDGDRLICGSGEGEHGSIQLLDVPSLRTVASVENPSGLVWQVAYLPDGRHALSAGGFAEEPLKGDYALRLWRLPETGDVPSIENQISELTERIEQAPTDGRARIDRAFLYVRQRRWREAADDFRAAGDAVYEKPGDAFGYAILLVHFGENDIYQRLCEQMLKQFAETDDVWTANCLVKSCLLRPGVVDPARLPARLLSADREFVTEEPPWVLREARALIAYRTGEFEECRREVRETMALSAYKDDPLYAPRALSILAMASYRSGDVQLARELYNQAVQKFDQIQLPLGHPGTIGWLYADILRREAAQVIGVEDSGAATRTQPEPFVVLAKPDIPERKFDTLAEAVAGASPGDTIEICGNGPFVSDPIDIDHALTIRAAAGYRPVIQYSAKERQGGQMLLLVRDSLVLEGLDLQQTTSEGSKEYQTIVHVGARSSLYAANCRFLSKAPAYSVHGHGSHITVLRNCEFLTVHWSALGWKIRPDTRIVIENCVQLGGISFNDHGVVNNQPLEGCSIRVRGNTIVTDSAFGLAFRNPPILKEGPPAEAAFRFECSANVFDSAQTVFYMHAGHLQPPFQPTDAEALLRRLCDWREQQNLYPADIRPLTLMGSEFGGIQTKRGQDLEDWNRFWDLEDTGSVQGRIRFQGGDLRAKAAADPGQLTPDDFRLRPDSAGYRAGPDGKDLGADVDFVGPGAAYERWKQTPEYQEWLEDTKRLMAEAQSSEVKQEISQQPGRFGPAVAPKPSTDN